MSTSTDQLRVSVEALEKRNRMRDESEKECADFARKLSKIIFRGFDVPPNTSGLFRPEDLKPMNGRWWQFWK